MKYFLEFALHSGGLAVAVPGELRGYRELYTRFGGRLPWRDLLEPTIKLCEEGHLVNWHMARALMFNRIDIMKEPSMRFVPDLYLESIFIVENKPID